MDGQWVAVEDDAKWLKVHGYSESTAATSRAVGFYGPSVMVPGVWKWNGLYD